MDFLLNILCLLCLCAGVQCVSNIRSLNCWFSDQESFKDDKGNPDIKFIHRVVYLKFDQKGDAPVNPDSVTFLLTGTNLDLRLHLEEAKEDELKCELHRYSTSGVHVPWPRQETQDYNHWYNYIIRHRLFTVTGFLRQPSLLPAPGQHDYHNWTVIKNGDVLTTTVALIMKTKTPEVKTALGSKTKLDCQFVIDHEGADYTVEWSSQINTRRTQLFSHNSRSGVTKGTGVDLKALKKGDASYDLPAVDKVSTGTFTCSLSMNPVVTSLRIDWTIEEKPEVSLTVKDVLSIENGKSQRIACLADHYYPLEVQMVWYRYKPAALSQKDPDVLNKMHPGHLTNHDGTVSLLSYLDLHPSVQDSGTQFICSVFHQSLMVPIRKTFILNVEDPVRNLFIFEVVFCAAIISAFLYMICNMRSARRRRLGLLPY
ncbi:tapasin-like [Salarias fasciatus]|uniref:tapasin-like n=1 Tax=Salarias fasciatus TaxID=181472 RepID=UPI001176BD80|nr:tapasin-like [Salarias fasciatus]